MRVTPIILTLAIAGCASTPPQLSVGAKAGLNAPMPTSENQRIAECNGTTNVIGGLKYLHKLQGLSGDPDGSIWATLERAKRMGCTQAEMDTPRAKPPSGTS
ncbi:hypothetical protein ABFV51_27275 [Pseudomonas asgharzadehiana]|uniref:hypothetical protein n=1 Tax=Pseudomonas TaxID=286 RepID=UPI0009B6A3B7|nr:hypothetical protein [Pseudomonas fluorescens]